MSRRGFPVNGLRRGTAAVLRVEARQLIVVARRPVVDGLITVDAIEGLQVEPGRYIVVPIELWEQTVRKAMIDPAAPPAETDLEVNAELPPTRQQRRRARFDA